MLRPRYRLHHVYERLLGTEVEVQIVARRRAQAEAAEAAGLDELERLTGLLNRFDPASEFSRWRARVGERQAVSPELWEALERAQGWQTRSGGAFHPAADALGALWKAGEARGEVPDPAELAARCEELRSPLWALHPDGSATPLSRQPLGLNALAKGLVVDRVAECVAAQPGVERVLVNAGGDLRTFGGPGVAVTLAAPWTARDDAPPLGQVWLRAGYGLASSGGAHRGYRIGGQSFSHLLDPRSGQPVARRLGVSALAPTCADADALATALSVLGRESLSLADALPGAAALLVGENGERWASARWDELTRPSPPARGWKGRGGAAPCS